MSVSDKDGCSALHRAAESGCCHCVRSLLERNSSANAIDRRGNSPLHKAIRNNHSNATAEILIAGADPDASGENGLKAIHLAAMRGNPEILSLVMMTLLERKSNFVIEGRAADGEDVLSLAIKSNSLDCVEILVEIAGLKVRKRHILIAKEAGSPSVWKMLQREYEEQQKNGRNAATHDRQSHLTTLRMKYQSSCGSEYASGDHGTEYFSNRLHAK